jgi:nitrogen fixation protein FixH
MVTAALLFTVGANVVMLFAAGGDQNGYVVERDYYRKAVAWDETMAIRAASAQLGWRARATLTHSGAGAGTLDVALLDVEGRAVKNATVTATLIHNRDAGNPREVALVATEQGQYAVHTSLPYAGLWEIRVDARRAAERFVTTLHADVSRLRDTASPEPQPR